jgi:hypothetical protein
MSTPLALSDEEMDVLHRLAAPIAWVSDNNSCKL